MRRFGRDDNLPVNQLQTKLTVSGKKKAFMSNRHQIFSVYANLSSRNCFTNAETFHVLNE